MQQYVRRAVITPGASSTNRDGVLRLDLVNEDGTPAGTVKKQAAQANSTATDVPGVVTDLNALLVKLRAAGVIA